MYAPNIPTSTTYGVSLAAFAHHCERNTKVHHAPEMYACFPGMLCQEFNGMAVVFNSSTRIVKYYRFSKEAQIW